MRIEISLHLLDADILDMFAFKGLLFSIKVRPDCVTA